MALNFQLTNNSSVPSQKLGFQVMISISPLFLMEGAVRQYIRNYQSVVADGSIIIVTSFGDLILTNYIIILRSTGKSNWIKTRREV